MKYTTWNNRLKMGLQAQELFRADMITRGYKILEEAPDNTSFKDFDFKLEYKKSGTIITAEIKNDRSKTPNIAIECSYKNRPSGIMSTKSDFYFVLNGGYWYVAKSPYLRNLLEEGQYRKVDNKKNANPTRLYLVPKTEFIDYMGEGIPNLFRLKVNSYA